MSILVIDIGTSGLRAGVVRQDGTITSFHYEPCPPSSPFPGLVEFDAQVMADAALRVCNLALNDCRKSDVIDAVGITNQRASTVLWSKSTGKPLGPALGWQDLRTVMECITAKAEHGLLLAPNQTATKAAWMLQNYVVAKKLDPSDVRIGTVDSWIASVLSDGALHITDSTNAGVTGLCSPDARTWSKRICGLLNIDTASLPRIINSSGVVGNASALPGAPPIAALIGDQQSSLIGQGCITPGATKITFGTGGMLNVFTGDVGPTQMRRSEHGTFPIVAYSDADSMHWAAEAIMLSAGTNIEWLRDDLGIIPSSDQSHDIAAQVTDSGGVMFVPALFGLGTPYWDYGARGTLLGLTRGSNRSHIVRAVLEGIAHLGADMLEAALSDTQLSTNSLRVDGGMSRNPTFIQALANTTGRIIQVSPVAEATTLGAAFLAGVAVGTWPSISEATSTWKPVKTVAPNATVDRAQWHEAVNRSRGWISSLSALDF
ncbi:MAG: glycerol kinase [Acidimicrobiaceae bacterium]|nr:glycerol kinase [Acidimicrobiaceae bacterium]